MSSAGLTITVLGTGTSQGVPVIGCTCPVCRSDSPRDKRLRTAIAVEDATTRVVIDIGPDFRQQMLTNELADVDAIVLTHEHNDHVSGLDEIRPINFLQRKSIPVYATPHVAEEVRSRFPYIFDAVSQYPGKPEVELIDITSDTLDIGTLHLLAIHVMHGNLPVLGFRFADFCYITDAKEISDEEMKKLTGLDVLILNALHHKPHFSHFNLTEALEMIRRIAPRQAYLTHISHKMGRHAVVEATLPPHVRLAYDGLQIQV